MTSREQETVWVFTGEGGKYPGGVFLSKDEAAAWIARHGLTGLLTEYPLNVGAWDWAVENGFFKPKRPEQSSSAFIGSFVTARLRHAHFENGSQTA